MKILLDNPNLFIYGPSEFIILETKKKKISISGMSFNNPLKQFNCTQIYAATCLNIDVSGNSTTIPYKYVTIF